MTKILSEGYNAFSRKIKYGKLISVGDDFIEFNVIDVDSMEYSETVLIHSPLILEVAIGGADVQRIVAEVSSKLTLE